LQVDPERRSSAAQLLSHHFLLKAADLASLSPLIVAAKRELRKEIL
jgi:hypothetical protein